MDEASLVSFFDYSSQTREISENIFEIANNLLLDQDDVQKGYGWMLKAASEAHQKEVFDYVMKNKDKMPRTALRYAIEKMPEPLRKKQWKNKQRQIIKYSSIILKKTK